MKLDQRRICGSRLAVTIIGTWIVRSYRLQMFDKWHPSLIRWWLVSLFNVQRTRRQREETMLLTVLWLYSDWTLHYINNSAYIHKHWTTQNKHELRTGRVRLLVSCLLNGFMWRCLCVENNRRGMTRCLMTGVTYGHVPGVWCCEWEWMKRRKSAIE